MSRSIWLALSGESEPLAAVKESISDFRDLCVCGTQTRPNEVVDV